MASNTNQTIVKVYAEALMNRTRPTSKIVAILEESSSLHAACKLPDFLSFMDLNTVSEPQKHDMIDKIFGKKIDDLLLNLMHLLIAKRRFALLPEILTKVRDMAEAEKGILPGVVKTAVEQSVLEKENIAKAIHTATKKKFNLEYEIDPAIIGGLIFRTDEILIDQSVRGHLRKLKDNILSAT